MMSPKTVSSFRSAGVRWLPGFSSRCAGCWVWLSVGVWVVGSAGGPCADGSGAWEASAGGLAVVSISRGAAVSAPSPFASSLWGCGGWVAEVLLGRILSSWLPLVCSWIPCSLPMLVSYRPFWFGVSSSEGSKGGWTSACWVSVASSIASLELGVLVVSVLLASAAA